MAIVSPVIRLVAAALCLSVCGIAETLSQELQRRGANEGLAFVHARGSSLLIIKIDGEWITENNPRDLSIAWLSQGGASTLWSVYYSLHHSPWFCPTPLIVELRGGVDKWKLPGEATTYAAGVSQDGKSVAFFGTFRPPGSGIGSAIDNRSKWITGLMFANRGTDVNVVFTAPASAEGEVYPVNSISWSPDGRAFAYDYRGRIYIFDVPRRTSRMVASGTSPDWSPDGHWIAFRSAEGFAYAVDPVTGRGRDLFGHRQVLERVHWSPDSRYVMLSERLGFISNLLHLRNLLLNGVMLVIRVSDGDSVPVYWIGPESPDDRGFDWVSDYRVFLKSAAIKPIVPGCE
jgi:hypothetical protein